MIFVTVSKDMFFERLIKKVDNISSKHSIHMVVQGGFEYSPESEKIEYHSTLKREDFEKYFDEASLVISHAGIGNIIMGKQKSKPMIIVPRLKDFREHYNDHQLEIAKKLENKKGFKVIYNIDDLDSPEVLNFSEKPDSENIEGKLAIINETRRFVEDKT